MSLESITNEEWEAATQGFNTSEDRATTANLMSQGISAAEARAQAAQQAQAQAQADAVRNLITGGASKDIVYGSAGGAIPDTMTPSFYETVKNLFGGQLDTLSPAPTIAPGPGHATDLIPGDRSKTISSLEESRLGDSAARYGLTPTNQLPSTDPSSGIGPGGGPQDFTAHADARDALSRYEMGAFASPEVALRGGFAPDVVGKGGEGPGILDSISEFFNPSYNKYGGHSSDYGITKGGDPGYRDFGGEDILSAIVGSPLLTAWQYEQRAKPEHASSRSTIGFDPAKMNYGSGQVYGLYVPDPNANMFPIEEGGNIEAIRRFLQDPVYGNIPQVDPMSSLTALQNAIGGIDALVGERGFTGQGYAQGARDRAQGIFDEFLPGQDVDALLNEKIGRAFAEEALTAKGSEFRQQGVQSIEQSFPEGFAGEIFSPEAFSKAAENIYGQKLQGAQDVIARAGARGQLSPRGGRLASESLLSQGPDVRGGISDIVSGVRSGLEGGLQGIRGSALEQAQGYQLGDELFDVTPFEQQASDYVTGAFGDIPSDISGAIGTDPLFDAVSALQTGGRQQGQVSGTPSFLDVLAEREGGVGTGRDRRGLGSRGSGVF